MSSSVTARIEAASSRRRSRSARRSSALSVEGAAALAVGVAIAVMHATGTFHPPAGIDPLIVVLNDMPWTFLVAPIGIGALILAAFAFVWHNLFRRGSWPVRWL